MSTEAAVLIVDAHVHLYPEFGAEAGLDAAVGHFREVAAGRGFTGILLLAEPEGEEAFPSVGAGDWSLECTPDPVSRWARRSDARLLLIAGFQVQTREGLEVLALCCSTRPEDRLPLDRVVREIRGRGGLAVVPWGAGKWLGRRGRVLSHFLDGVGEPVFLGDNGGRPGFWRPRHFSQARDRGIRVLSGSDPLPFASQAARVGRHGFVLPGHLPSERPAEALVGRLEQGDAPLESFGPCESPLRFLGHQLAMQWRLHGLTGRG